MSVTCNSWISLTFLCPPIAFRLSATSLRVNDCSGSGICLKQSYAQMIIGPRCLHVQWLATVEFCSEVKQEQQLTGSWWLVYSAELGCVKEQVKSLKPHLSNFSINSQRLLEPNIQKILWLFLRRDSKALRSLRLLNINNKAYKTDGCQQDVNLCDNSVSC